MARPLKQGLDYFSFDVDFFEDEKIVAISSEFNCKGEAVLIRLLCAIYRNGAFIQYDDLLARVVAKKAGVSVGLVNDVVDRAARYGFFDKSVFEKFRVLTSRGIQNRYLKAKELKQFSFIPEQYLLVDFPHEKDVVQQKGNELGLNGSFSTKNSNTETVFRRKTQQRKVKESKVNTSADAEVTRTREAAATAAEPFVDPSEIFSPQTLELCDEIAAKFNVIDGRVYARQVESLLRSVHRPNVVDGATVIRDALKRLDTAKAILAGKPKMTITRFLREDIFLRLINGDYDEVYSNKPKKQTPDIGVSFEQLREDGYYS